MACWVSACNCAYVPLLEVLIQLRVSPQDDDSSADTVSKVAESLHNMKHARVGDGGASAFSPFTAVVSRPCARGDATAERRADALPQVRP